MFHPRCYKVDIISIMDSPTVRWTCLILLLCLSTFGVHWCVTLLISCVVLLIGLISLFYIRQGDVDVYYRNFTGNPLMSKNTSDGGLFKIVKTIKNHKDAKKTDKRVTGSELIDSSLQEILSYAVRDYISPWYGLISTDTEFPDIAIRKTAQSLAINISNRVKEVDWIPFLTTKLVDDVATHLRLFKQARAKVKRDEKLRQGNSPRRDVRSSSSPKRAHKRNKSETDVSWYFGNKTERKGQNLEQNGKRTRSNFSPESAKRLTLEDYFFELEYVMENNLLCHYHTCTDTKSEKEFLSELVELLLFILLSDEDFQCKSLRYILREVLSNWIIFPVFKLLSDPDYINQVIIWLCLRDAPLPSDAFLTTLRSTDNCDELRCTKEIVNKEIHMLRSRDTGGESDFSIKQQLGSLTYVVKLIENRLSKLDNFDTLDAPLENIKFVDLSLKFILKNNVALHYFMEYVSLQGRQAYLCFYLTIEGWKVTVEQQLSDVHLRKIKGRSENSGQVYENIRHTATNIYDQYLGDKREQIIDINLSLVHSLYFKIRNPNELPTEQWFDEIQFEIYSKMERDHAFLPSFKTSHSYLKLLEDLDLVSQGTDEDTLSVNSLDLCGEENGKTGDKTLINLCDDDICFKKDANASIPRENASKIIKHIRSLSDVTDFTVNSNNDGANENFSVINDVNDLPSAGISNNPTRKNHTSGSYTLGVNIIETGIVCEKGKTFGIYAIEVNRKYETGYSEEWHIYRRYSDFYDLHSKVKDKFSDLSKLAFPGKKTFHNMDRSVLERRMRMLGTYMNQLCNEEAIRTHSGLRELLVTFLEQGEYDRATSGGPIMNTIDIIVNPFKSGMKTIKNMPEQIFNTVDEVVEGLNKVFHSKQQVKQETSKVGASLDVESDDNIPLRIMLLLMDEVFDLKSRNQWLRRRIITLLRQILRTMFGDIVNRKILDYVSLMTSPKNVAGYLHTFKQSFWPNGIKAERKSEREEDVKSRTRVAAKAALLSCLSDELKHIIGSETTRKGLLMIFELFQKPTLNRRLLYVLLEDILSALFQEKNMAAIFRKMHSKCKNHGSRSKELNTQETR